MQSYMLSLPAVDLNCEKNSIQYFGQNCSNAVSIIKLQFSCHISKNKEISNAIRAGLTNVGACSEKKVMSDNVHDFLHLHCTSVDFVDLFAIFTVKTPNQLNPISVCIVILTLSNCIFASAIFVFVPKTNHNNNTIT